MRDRRTAAILILVLSASPTVRLSAQGDLDRLAARFAAMTAVTGLEQSMADSLRALLPGSTPDRVGNVTLTLGQGSPKRLCTCPLDEVGYVVANILPDGFLLLRRDPETLHLGRRARAHVHVRVFHGEHGIGRTGRGLGGRGAGSRDHGARARVARQAAATLRRAAARCAERRAPRRLRGAGRGSPGEA